MAAAASRRPLMPYAWMQSSDKAAAAAGATRGGTSFRYELGTSSWRAEPAPWARGRGTRRTPTASEYSHSAYSDDDYSDSEYSSGYSSDAG